MHLYTFNPFDKDNYLIKLKTREFKDLYYKNVGNLKKYPIYVSMLVDGVRSFGKHEHGFDGVDGNVAALLEEKLNATFVYIENNKSNSSSSKVNSEDFLTKDIADVKHERANLSMNSRWLYVQDMIENTNSYEQNNLCVIVPKAKQIPSFYNLFYTMQAETWIVAIFFVIIIIFVYFVIQMLNKRVNKREKDELNLGIIDIMFYMLQSFFGDSLTKLPKAASLRLIIITWLGYSLIISSAFTGTLISKIAIPLYENDINTIDEIKESGMDIIIRQYVYQTEHIWNLQLFKSLKPQMKYLNKSIFDEYLNKNISGLAFATSDSRADFEIARRGDDKAGRPIYHKINDRLIYFPRGYIATLGSPYIGMINDLLGRFFEGGFNNHFESLAEFKARIKGMIKESDDEQEEDDLDEDDELKVILSMKHLESAFILLFIGLSFSTVIFLGEHLHHRYYSRKKNVIYPNVSINNYHGYMRQWRQKVK